MVIDFSNKAKKHNDPLQVLNQDRPFKDSLSAMDLKFLSEPHNTLLD
jgi:hypothetical protein